MKRYILTLGILLACTPLLAIFSAHELINPDFDSDDFHPTVTYKNIGEKKNLLTVSGVNNNAWLVVCSEPIKKGKKDFRSLVWSLSTDTSYLRNGWGMNPSMKSIELISPIRVKEGEIKIHLSGDLAARAYVVIDFDSPVDDGGFYYTVDIPEFHKQTGANKSR
jgi:hypothetical protein